MEDICRNVTKSLGIVHDDRPLAERLYELTRLTKVTDHRFAVDESGEAPALLAREELSLVQLRYLHGDR